MIYIKDYTETRIEDARYVFANLRDDDKRMFSEYKDMEEAFAFHAEKSCEIKIAYNDEKPMCLFGITNRYPVLNWKYLVFHFGTPEVDQHRKSFVKVGRLVLNHWLKKYGNLYMTAHSYYKKSFTMAKAFGFKFKFNIYDIYIFAREMPLAETRAEREKERVLMKTPVRCDKSRHSESVAVQVRSDNECQQ